MLDRRAAAWESAYLTTVGAHSPKKFPTDLGRYLDPNVDADGVRKLSDAEAAEHRQSFESMVAASNKVPVKPSGQ